MNFIESVSRIRSIKVSFIESEGKYVMYKCNEREILDIYGKLGRNIFTYDAIEIINNKGRNIYVECDKCGNFIEIKYLLKVMKNEFSDEFIACEQCIENNKDLYTIIKSTMLDSDLDLDKIRMYEAMDALV